MRNPFPHRFAWSTLPDLYLMLSATELLANPNISKR